MRVRLLIDITLLESEIPALAELIAKQPRADVDIHGWRGNVAGRFMGAQPVHTEELETTEGTIRE